MSFPVTTPQATPPPEPPRVFSAHINVGTIVTSVLGFMLVFLVNRGIQNLDALTTEVGHLNAKMAVVLARHDVQEKKDAEQDRRLDRHHERFQQLEELVSRIHGAQRAK